ncbi:HYD1 signature containing ADP-ribosyltransferase family protein [Solwaraspora sp. WMMD1047]|uniref:HYD1 signature containing ADP-ribosyltransferase family protein n=1 Tax=Solwaraspora sp. WMMD1047 TaxID=3016102 RepID=UPI0024178849|nr:HYD1 signature containing ADP-ribosyltransferase family protein [Solwaraspora sp. WMMD1047]MDG4831587.1 HYD1 signature containing ADP-ribosyltransferase family protein [Solwaraspora sp. WMMD1047]
MGVTPGFRLLCHALAAVLFASLLVVTPFANAAGAAAPPVAAPGRGPVQRPLPETATPRHGLPEGETAPAVPPVVAAAGEPKPAKRSALARAAAPGQTMNAASEPVLRAGYLLGDTSLVAYFDGDVDRGNPDSWAQWWATVTDVESGQEQRSVVLGQSDLAECRSPRRFCRSFGAADGWVLAPDRRYTVVITVGQPDGSEVVSPPSNEAAPRATPAPPAIPAAQAAGCGCPTVLGPTLTGQAVRGAGVNTATGAFSRTEPDLVMPSAGIAFNAVRYYSSANPTAGMFGTGWSWSYDARIVADEGGSVRVRAEDGSEAVYRRTGDGSYDPPAGIRAKLTAVTGGGWQLVPPDQRRLRFDAQGRLISITNARGLGLTLTYDTTGLLTRITDASNRVVTIEHRTDLRLIRKITLPDNRSVQFDYDAGRLGKVQDPRGFNTSYQYDGAGRLTSITDARGNTAIRNSYDAAGRVTTQTDPEGGQTTFGWTAGSEAGATLLATTTDPDRVAMVDGYRDNVLLFSRNSNQDVVVHRYDGKLRRSLVVDPKGNQEETRHDDDGNPVARRAPDPFAFTTASTFDDRSNLTEHRDGRGNTWVYEFNQFNEMTAQRNPKQERGYTYAYDSRGQQISRTDPRGKVTRYEYDAHGNRTAEITPTGRRTEMFYDLTGRMTSLVDPRGTVAGGNRDAYRTRFVYDQQNRIREVWQPGKPQPFRTDYDELGNVVVSTDPLSNSSRMTYDRNSRLTEVKDPIGNVTAQAWTPGGRRDSVTDGEGNKTSWTYNAEGRVATETSPRGNADPEHAEPFTTRFHYDYNGNLIRADKPYGTDGERVQVDTAFDELDRPNEQRDQFNESTKVGYDNNGNVTEMTNERGEKLSHSFDEANRRDGSSGAAGAAQIDYDEAGNPIRQVTPTDGVITWRYDDDGRPIAITEPRGNVAGADPDQYTTRYAYDRAGNLESVTDPLDNVTRTGYDALNRVVSLTDANNKTTRYGYDAADRLATVTGPDAQPHQSTSYGYNANGQVIKRTDPLGRVASMEYDRAGRLTVSTDPLGRRRDLVYDRDSNLIEQVTARQVEPGDPGGPRPDPNRPARTIFYGYDNLNRLVSKQLGAGGDRYTYAYDAKNRPVEAADPTGLRTWEYDKTDRLIRAVRGDDIFGYTYDGDDRVKNRTYPDGTVVTADYDAGDRVRALTVAKAGTSSRYGFDYDVSDNLTTVTYPESTGVVQDRGYDRAGRLTSVDNHRGDQVLSAFELTPDPVGNPKQITTRRGEPGQPTITETTAYEYDAANRITAACYGAQTCAGPVAERLDYTYDLVGNRATHKVTAPGENTTTTYTYDAADQLKREVTTGSRSTERSFDYDLEGNQIRAGADRYTYALDHTMTSATIGGRTTDYRYDALGNRVTATSGSGADARTQEWDWDLNAPMPMLATESETTGAGTTTRGYLYDPGGNPLALLAPDGAAYSYTQDWLGGVADVLAPDGAQQWAYEYDPFGVARGEGLTDGGRKLSADAPANPMQYAGGYHDTSQGDRYQLRARNYDPGTGRFDATDPAPTAATSPAISSYAYANNQPTVHTDPTGLRVDDGGGGGGGTPTVDTPTEPVTPGGTEQCEANSSDPNCVDNPAYLGAKNLVTEAEGFIAQIADEIINLILDLVGFNDAKKCVTEGDIVACISTALQAVPWGKMFKAAKVMIKAVGVGRRLVESYGKLRAARAALAKIPQKVRKAGATADEAADANKYAKQVANNAGGAKTAGAQAKNTTRKQTEGLKQRQAKQRQENTGGESCKIAKGRGVNSFAPGTPVRMADGSSKPIEQVEPGDSVVATDPETGETNPQQVTAAVEGTGTKHLIDLTLVGAGAGGGGPPATVTATDGHRFYSPTRGWAEAAHLKVGDELRDEFGTPVTVAKLSRHTRQATVHNLTVNDTHTYYVEAGTTPVLVHNCDTLYHYTDKRGHDAILASGELRPSLKANNPKDARYGDGQYLTDIKPGTKTLGQLSAAFLRVPWAGRKFTHYIEIDVRGLEVVQGRPGVFVVPNSGPLDLTGRIVSSGRN